MAYNMIPTFLILQDMYWISNHPLVGEQVWAASKWVINCLVIFVEHSTRTNTRHEQKCRHKLKNACSNFGQVALFWIWTRSTCGGFQFQLLALWKCQVEFPILNRCETLWAPDYAFNQHVCTTMNMSTMCSNLPTSGEYSQVAITTAWPTP